MIRAGKEATHTLLIATTMTDYLLPQKFRLSCVDKEICLAKKPWIHSNFIFLRCLKHNGSKIFFLLDYKTFEKFFIKANKSITNYSSIVLHQRNFRKFNVSCVDKDFCLAKKPWIPFYFIFLRCLKLNGTKIFFLIIYKILNMSEKFFIKAKSQSQIPAL